MENLAKDFLQWLDLNRGYAENTRENYERTLKFFNAYLIGENKNGINKPEEIKITDVDNFILKERENGKCLKTCNNYIASIKLFLKWNLIKGRDVEDYRKILASRGNDKKIEALTEEDGKKLFDYFKNIDASNRPQGELVKKRNIVICDLLLYTGMRVNELSSLKIDEIGEEIQIVGKGGVRRPIFLFDEDLKFIRDYLNLRNDDCPYLLVSHVLSGEIKRLSNVSIDRIIRKGGEACGMKVRPHMLRHTFATNLLKKNAKLPYIQKLLGHKNINTTQTYLTVLDNELKETSKLLRG